MKNARTLGERRIIEIIQNHLEQMPQILIPFGDDVSAFKTEGPNIAVLKTDMLVAKTDVPPGMNLWQAARKAVVMNVSDFAAKGVQPTVVLVSLGLQASLTQRDIESIASGLNAGARQYDAYVVGGDTGEASDLIISVSLFGFTKKDQLMRRKGARPGDIVAVTGPFGKSSAGLHILKNHLRASREISNILVESVLRPNARLREGLALAQTRSVTAAIDSSDGLAWSLHEIARASKVGISIGSLPIAPEVEKFAQDHNLDSAELSLYGGEEYELVLTVRPDLWNQAKEALRKTSGELLPIGKVTARRGVQLKVNGRWVAIKPRGYEHFGRELQKQI